MENEKYQGTMYSHCNSTLTDRMKAADTLVKNLEYIKEHILPNQLDSISALLKEVEKEILTRCVTPRFHLSSIEYKSTSDLFNNIIYHLKAISHEIYTAWVAGVQGYTPVFSDCVNDISQKIQNEMICQYVLSNRESRWRGRR